jgi:elongation factor Ts
MAEINAAMVKQLREKTGAGMMDCKSALTEVGGDMEKAIEFLRKKGLATAQKRAGRAMTEGTIQSYIHMNAKLGVLVEVNCETDFVAKNDDFQGFAKNIAMHIAASNPLGMALDTGKPENVLDKIVDGKLKKFYQDNCLMNQPYVRNPDITVADLLNELIAKIGENISIKRFVRYQIGE